jgi:hypothetical protein
MNPTAFTVSAILAASPLLDPTSTPHQVYQIESLSQLLHEQPPKTLYLFDLDDTVFDSPYMLGSRAWRRYIAEATKKLDATENWHDIFSYEVAKKIAVITVEEITAPFIKELQCKGHISCGLTSRERLCWYGMPQNGIDQLTVDQLLSVGIDFNKGSLEQEYPSLSSDAEYYKGTFFANISPKGHYLLHVLKGGLYPIKIVFIDDKLDQVISVAEALTQLGIPHECYHYTATEKKSLVFNPLIANVQLYYFYKSSGTLLLSDQEAAEIAGNHSDIDAGAYLQEVLEMAKKTLPLGPGIYSPRM